MVIDEKFIYMHTEHKECMDTETKDLDVGSNLHVALFRNVHYSDFIINR